jgi:hypothetical protein
LADETGIDPATSEALQVIRLPTPPGLLPSLPFLVTTGIITRVYITAKDGNMAYSVAQIATRPAVPRISLQLVLPDILVLVPTCLLTALCLTTAHTRRRRVRL